MNNPYNVLKVSQTANKREIMRAQMLAMKEKKYTLQEIAIAVRQLLNPAKRLAADFMFPSRIKAKRIHKIRANISVKNVDFKEIDENALNSLK